MELEAHDRDQILYACSAQNNKLLPKPRKKSGTAKQKLHNSVAPIFDQLGI